MTRVTIAIAAYCEGLAFGAKLVSLADYLSLYASSYEFDFLIIDDGSTDETLEVARSFARFRPNVTVLSHLRNAGLGRCIRTMLQTARGEFVVTLDADMSYSADTAIDLLDALQRNDADVAVASPYMRGGSVVNVPWLRRLLSREANRFLSLATNGRYATLTSMVRAYRTSFAREMPAHANGMEINPELLFLALKNGGTVVEVPARLQWSEERRSGPPRTNVKKLVKQTYAVLATGFAYRPALWLAVPGLFPGLLPIVVALLLILRVPSHTLAIWTVITVAVQYGSLAIFAGQLTSFFTASLSARHRAKVAHS